MKTTLGNNLSVELRQAREKGTPWQVYVYKKVLGFKKQVSCDWFLDGDQAKKFADQLTKELQTNRSNLNLKERSPGWTLHRAAH
jgi:uncharacterized membrane protein